MVIEERTISVDGVPTRYLAAGEGPPLLLLHATGESALDWQCVLPALARTHCAYAPDLLAFGDHARPAADYSPAALARFVARFLDLVEVERAAVVGNSLGGLVALHLALAEPTRVAALGLVASGGLGRAVSPALRPVTLPGCGELAIAWCRTPLGAAQRARGRVPLLFARPERVPPEWLAEQVRLAQLPGFMEATVAALREQLDLRGQREIVLDQLPRITVPTLIIWGERDRVLPKSQARRAVSQLERGTLALIPDCGHLPQVERPDSFVTVLSRFLAESY